MKELITDVKFLKEGENKYGKYYSFKVQYNGRTAYYNSKRQDQTNFVKGQESEFTEETKTGTNGDYLIVKPLNQNKQSGWGKALKKEQTRYSGFAVSYSKDLVCAGKLPLEDLPDHAWTLFELMVAMDKSIEA
jgi:hypothetical protein